MHSLNYNFSFSFSSVIEWRRAAIMSTYCSEPVFVPALLDENTVLKIAATLSVSAQNSCSDSVCLTHCTWSYCTNCVGGDLLLIEVWDLLYTYALQLRWYFLFSSDAVFRLLLNTIAELDCGRDGLLYSTILSCTDLTTSDDDRAHCLSGVL